ncbi:nicotinate phosphoribosyltransferase [Patescibacteria group bacterium]|nr:nicotinate phosphoribosyltransferase [Patescibacteria group bacterium]MBU1890293.1 nicotinate phosphoribosyltransferase [Patescibacteria group bacterium]
MTDTRLLRDEELSLYSLDQNFCVCSTFYDDGKADSITTFDLLVRDLPDHRNFLLAGGLEAIIQLLTGLKYSDRQVQHLIHRGRISESFAEYLRHFKFTGDIDAFPEGSLYFPGEPLVRITAPIIEANLITDQMISLGVIDTMLLSKIARVRLAAQDRRIGVGFVRAQGIDAGWRAGRNADFFENTGVSNEASAMRGTGKVAVVNASHAFIKSFPDELTAFRAITKHFPEDASLMIDTYSIEQGLRNAITIGKELKQQGNRLFGITIDSGDFLKIAKQSRKDLDAAGLVDTKITVTGNLDEYKIHEMMKKGIPADTFLVVTEVVTNADAPTIEMVYKMSQIEEGGKLRHTAKFAPGKLSLPGKKQVFRIFENGLLKKDIIGLDDESLGEPQLIPILRHGKQVYDFHNQEEQRAYVKKQLKMLPEKYLDLFHEHKPPLEISPKVKELQEQVRVRHQAIVDEPT